MKMIVVYNWRVLAQEDRSELWSYANNNDNNNDNDNDDNYNNDNNNNNNK